MNKNEFVNELRKALYGIPQQEIDSSVQFYSEMIDDRMEEGMSEEEAVASLGNINDIARQIRGGAAPFSRPYPQPCQNTQKRKITVVEIVLIVISFPIWFPVLMGLVSIYITVWFVILALYIAALALGIAAIGCIASVIFSVTGAAAILTAIGAGFVLIGLAIFSVVGLNHLSILYARLTVWLGKTIASVF